MEPKENVAKLYQDKQPFDWADCLDSDTISRIILGARGEFQELLDAAEMAMGINPNNVESEVLGVVLQAISRLGVYDHAAVGHMLDVLFEESGHFFSIFAGALMAGEDISEKDMRSAEYFLTIGSRKSYLLGDGTKVQFVDVPILNITMAGIALRRGRPAALKTFLRYGADPEAALKAVRGPQWDPRRRLTSRRKRCLELIASNVSRRSGALAALLPIPPGPRSLKHTCKVAVRRCLARAGSLPLGIPTLHLPHELHRYLDLDDTYQ